MKKYYTFKTVLLFSIVLTIASCNSKQAEKQAPRPLKLKVTQIEQKTVTSYKLYPATIEGKINSEVRAKISGYIQKVYVDEGQKVTKNQPLFKIETQSLSQEADAAKSNIIAAEVEVKKLEPLVAKNIISPIQLETAKAKLEQAKSNYNSINANIDYATVKSPIDGHIGAIQYREGSLVSATNAMPLTIVSNREQVYAYFSMNKSEYLDFLKNTKGKNLTEKLNNSPKVKLVLANGDEYKEEGTIQTVTGQIDPNTGTVSFRAIFNNPNTLITNGNSGTIKVPTLYENSFVIPQIATFEQQGQTFVYTINEENMAIATLIEVKDTSGGLYIVSKGIKKGDRLVIEGIGKLRNNTVIEPVDVPFSTAIKPLNVVFQ